MRDSSHGQARFTRLVAWKIYCGYSPVVLREYDRITSSSRAKHVLRGGTLLGGAHPRLCGPQMEWGRSEAALVLLHPSMHISVRSSHVVAMKSPRNHASHNI